MRFKNIQICCKMNHKFLHRVCHCAISWGQSKSAFRQEGHDPARGIKCCRWGESAKARWRARHSKCHWPPRHRRGQLSGTHVRSFCDFRGGAAVAWPYCSPMWNQIVIMWEGVTGVGHVKIRAGIKRFHTGEDFKFFHYGEHKYYLSHQILRGAAVITSRRLI